MASSGRYGIQGGTRYPLARCSRGEGGQSIGHRLEDKAIHSGAPPTIVLAIVPLAQADPPFYL
jgi:hypothetical protein